MAEPRSKLDILYQDVLGDLHDVLIRVETLKAEIPAAADKMGDALNTQAGNYLAAAEKAAAVLADLASQVDAYADASAKQAAEAAKLDIRQAATQAASEAVQAEIGKEIQGVVGLINQAARNLVTETDKARGAINAASQQVRWGWGKGVVVMVAGSFIGGLVAMASARYIPGVTDAHAQLTATQRMAIENSEKIQAVWNRLTPKEREHIQELSNGSK